MANKLPNAEEAIVESGKLIDYLLSQTHPVGMGKAKFFKAFEITVDNFEVLETALLEHGLTKPVVKSTDTKFGTKFELECSITTPDSRNPCIRSVWIIETGKSAPRLVTAYPN